MHWSKTRHVDYRACPRRFFYSNVAAPRNPEIRALDAKQSPPLIRHDLVRRVIGEVSKVKGWGPDEIPATLARSKAALEKVIPDSLQAAAQLSIVEQCLVSFANDILPEIRAKRLIHATDGTPTEFVYSGLSIMALPELVLDGEDHLQIMTWRTGSSDFRVEDHFRLKAGGLTCWARKVLNCIDRPVRIVEVFLREPGVLYSGTLSDDEVRHFVSEAKGVAAGYSASAKIRDFPAKPDSQTCRFCPYKPICPEYKQFAEVDYEIESLSREVAQVVADKEAGLVAARGEIRSVFLSHADDDKEDIVRPFARLLEAHDISYWLDEAELKWGDSLFQGINRGLQISDYVICFFSDAFLARGWPSAELAAGHAAQMKDGQKRLLPIMVTNAAKVLGEYPLLGDKKYMRWSDGQDKILKALREVLKASRGDL